MLSKPLSLDIPTGIAAATVATARGPLATLDTGRRPDAALSPAVLIPGFTGSKEDFLPVLGALAATGRRILAFDQRGQYESTGPDDTDFYSVGALADDLIDVITATGAPVHLVAHSFGGIVSRDAVIRRPELVRSLTLLDSGPSALTGDRRVHLEFLGPLLADGGLPAVYGALAAAQASDPVVQALPQEIRDFLERRFLAQSATAVLVTGAALMEEPDRVDELRAAYLGPILVACGEADDAWTPDVQKDMADRLGAPFELIPDAVHSPAVENPAATGAVLTAFWDRVESGTR